MLPLYKQIYYTSIYQLSILNYKLITMCRRIIQVFIGLLSIILLSLGVTFLMARDKLMREETYLTPINDKGIYKDSVSYALTQVSSSLNQDEKIIFSTVRDQFSKGNQIENIIKTTAEKTAGYIFSWIRGEEKEVYVYFPREEIKQLITAENLKQTIVATFDEQYKDYDSYPICTQEQLKDFDPSHPLIVPNCKVPGFETKEKLKAKFTENIDAALVDYNPESIFEGTQFNYSEKTSLKTILDDTNKTKATEIITELEKFKTNVYFAGILGVAFIMFGVMFGLIALLLAKMTIGNVAKVWLNIAIFTGIIMTAIGGFGLIISIVFFSLTATTITRYIKEIEIDPALAKKFIEVFEIVLNSVFMPILVVGAIVFVVALVLRIIVQILFKVSKLV